MAVATRSLQGRRVVGSVLSLSKNKDKNRKKLYQGLKQNEEVSLTENSLSEWQQYLHIDVAKNHCSSTALFQLGARGAMA